MLGGNYCGRNENVGFTRLGAGSNTCGQPLFEFESLVSELIIYSAALSDADRSGL